MIQNKKLFFLTLIFGVIAIALLDIPWLYHATKNYQMLGLWFIFNAIMGEIIYALLFISLKKAEVIKIIYTCVVILGILVFVTGILMITLL